MRKVALRGLLEHKGRLIATFLAVALGVAFMGGVQTLTDTMNRSFDDLFADVYRDTDAVVRATESIGGGFDEFEVRAQVPASLVEEVGSVDEVAEAAGDVSGFARVIGPDGEPVGNPATGAPTFGGNWVDNDDLNPFSLTDGRAPEGAGEILMDRGTAESTGYEVGDTVPVQTQAGVEEFELVGITRFGSADSPGGSSFVLWTTPEAQRLVGQPDQYQSISVVAREGLSQTEVARSIRPVLPEGTEVLTGQQITEESQSQLREQLSFLTTFFLAFAVIALVVGSFVIYNSFAIIVAQRTKEMALLRAIGASQKQVRRAVLTESVVVGLVGSAVGLVLGLGLASVFVALIGLPDASLAVLPTSILTALLIGLFVTITSALIPARRAARIPPLAAMREVDVDTSGRSRLRFLAGLAIVALGGAGVAAGAAASEPATVGIGLAVAFVGVLVASPGLAQPVSRVLGAPVARWRGVAGRLARENAGRNPKRTSSTAQALMIGVGVVAFILVINASIRASVDQTLEETFTGDFVVDSGTFGTIGLPPQVARDIAGLRQVDYVAPVRFSPAFVDGDESGVTATNVGGLEIFDFRFRDLSPELQRMIDAGDRNADIPSGTMVISDDKASSAGLSAGDTVEVRFLDSGTRTFTVGGIYVPEPGAEMGSYLIGLEDYAAAVPNATDAQVMVKLAPGVTVEEAQPEIQRIVEPYVTAEVQNVDEFKDSLGGQLDVLLNLVFGLLALAIVIAMLGIANTVALSVIERTREIGLLRAVGMSRRQLRSAIRWESVIISLFGTLLGLAVGLLGGWGLVTALGDDGFNVFALPVAPIVVVSLIAGFLGMLAALIPAWRASRLDVLDAIESP